MNREHVTIKEYIDMQAQLNKEWMLKYVDAKFDGSMDAVNKANASMDKRMDSINEFRGQLKDQSGTFITRKELWGWLIAIIAIVIGAMGLMKNV